MATFSTKMVCAVVVNDYGDILPYSCQATMQRCEEWAQEHLLGWDTMKQLGARVVQAELAVAAKTTTTKKGA